jgi:excisionase family DNA binding protein
MSEHQNQNPYAIPFLQRPTCSIAEACSAAGFGRTKMYELIDGGAVKAVKIGRRRLVQVPSLLQLLGQSAPK